MKHVFSWRANEATRRKREASASVLKKLLPYQWLDSEDRRWVGLVLNNLEGNIRASQSQGKGLCSLPLYKPKCSKAALGAKNMVLPCHFVFYPTTYIHVHTCSHTWGGCLAIYICTCLVERSGRSNMTENSSFRIAGGGCPYWIPENMENVRLGGNLESSNFKTENGWLGLALVQCQKCSELQLDRK